MERRSPARGRRRGDRVVRRGPARARRVRAVAGDVNGSASAHVAYRTPIGGFLVSARPRLLTAALVCCAVAALPAQGVHHGLDPVNLDTTCAPCLDFYRYANGGWLARTSLPPEYASYGSFTELADRNNETLHRIVDGLAVAAPAAPKTPEQKLGAFYASCMDSSAIERAGADPLKNELARIAAIASRADVARALARGHHHGWDPVFNFGGTADFKRSTMIIAAASQGGLGLPDRDYYVRNDSTARALRTAYLEYVSRTLGLLGDAPAVADSEAQRILALETALARASLTRVERRDPNANYHKLPLPARALGRERAAAALEALHPGCELHAGRRARPGVREGDVHTRRAPPRARHGRSAGRRLGRPAAHPRMDGRLHPGSGGRQVTRLRQENRLSGQVARLLQAAGGRRTTRSASRSEPDGWCGSSMPTRWWTARRT